MKRKVISLIIGLGCFLLVPGRVMAIVDPLVGDNNKVGVHLLSPDELEVASKLVNGGNSGSWGYVVVPIQATDRNRVKWEKFMKRARELKVIPIIRVATLVSQVHWEEPNNYDLVDFANFLNELSWPTKNRYVIIFNEVNRADEYGGFVSPERYAEVLSNAITIFKERNEDFFMLPAGMDNAAANSGTAMKWSNYLQRMEQSRPGIFSMIDGWTSHSYPNYGFVGRVSDNHDHSIRSYIYELNLIAQYTDKKLPVFITETGWDMESVGEVKVAENFREAFATAWNSDQIVTVAPFVLMAGDGPFTKFSLLRKDSSETLPYAVLKQQVKRGAPVEGPAPLPPILKGVTLIKEGNDAFWTGLKTWEPPKVDNFLNRVVDWFLGKTKGTDKTIKIGDIEYKVEIADTSIERQLGLSGRERLGEKEGMLFTFPGETMVGFWMPNMNFDIDIVWIKDRRVIGVSFGDKTKPTETIAPPSPVNWVLEVNKNSGIKVGDEVVLE